MEGDLSITYAKARMLGMSESEPFFFHAVLPYDTDAPSLDAIWTRLQAALRQRATEIPAAGSPHRQVARDARIQLSPAELRAMLSALHDLTRTAHALIARVEAVLEGADC